MATIDDVARAAGVSTSTVSYVLSGRRPISPETRARVEASITELGYRPNAGARALASRRSKILALVAPLRSDNGVPVIMHFVAGIATAARSYDHDVLLVTQDEGPTGLARVSEGAMVDGLIVMDVEADDQRVPVLRKLGRPSVLIGLPDAPSGLNCVDLDFAGAGYEAVAHLANHGHKRVALVGPPSAVYERRTSFATRVLSGFETGVSTYDLTATTTACELTYDGAATAIAKIFDAVPDVTGLVVHNEASLGPILAVLRSSGIVVPRDLSIIAICPDDVAVDLPLPVTSIDIPGEKIGAMAVDMVMGILDESQGAETRLLAPRITDRGSCAPPPER